MRNALDAYEDGLLSYRATGEENRAIVEANIQLLIVFIIENKMIFFYYKKNNNKK